MFGRDHYKVARQFVEAVNARDLAAIGEIVGEHCRIVDARGYYMEGKQTCLEGLERLFALEPEYRIHVQSIGRNGDNLLITGRATACDPHFAETTLWRARTDDRHLHEWQSYSSLRGPAITRLLVGDKAQKGFLEGRS